MSTHASLRQRLNQSDISGAIGVHDGFSARLLANAGGEIGFVSGAGISFSRLGMPDLGFLTISDLTDVVRNISHAAPGLDLIVDIDTGFGNAINTAHAVRTLERAGANALQIEDQTFPKRCGHLAGKSVIEAAEMAGKIRAACEARTSADTLIFARTDAFGVHGLADALERGEAYLEAGADALFIEAPAMRDDMVAIAKQFAHRTPLIHNLVEGGTSPVSSLAELEALGYRLGLFPLMFLHAAIPAQSAILEHVLAHGATANYSGPLAKLADLNRHIGTDEALATGLMYQGDDKP
jgi:2-methylisocitrate lyase-like PEP mutase family enzyme